MYLGFLTFLLSVCSILYASEQEIHRNKNHGHKKVFQKKIAVIWCFTSGVPFYFELTVATLLNSGADNIDIHVLTKDPENYNQTMKFPQIFFHQLESNDLTRRIKEHTGVTIDYDFTTSHHKKIADLKPMLGLLFQDFIPMDIYGYWIYGDTDGLFGSYNALVDYSILPSYDVISGIPQFTKEKHKGLEVMAGVPTRASGAWTMWRNNPKVNTLFMRSKNWESMLKNGNEVYAFDENTRPFHPDEESVSQVLDFSNDIRQCCINRRLPPVLRGDDTIFLAEMYSRFIELPGATITYRWEKGKGGELTLEGNVGFQEVYRKETVKPLFFHFLQWKNYAGVELYRSLNNLLNQIKDANLTPMTVECFHLKASNGKSFEWKLC